MESNKGITPPAAGNRIKASLLTPCRRLGLPRKSPASSGSWNAPKSSKTFSPLKRKFECEGGIMKEITEDCINNQHTPKRRVSLSSYKRPPLKMLKTGNSPCVSGDVSGCNSRLLLKFKAPAVARHVSPERESEDSLSLPMDLISVDNVTENMVKDLRIRVKKKEEQLKDLRQAQIYKKKHDVKTLQTLIEKWHEGCQSALRELHSLLRMQGHNLTMEHILNSLRIPHNLVSYSAESDDFE